MVRSHWSGDKFPVFSFFFLFLYLYLSYMTRSCLTIDHSIIVDVLFLFSNCVCINFIWTIWSMRTKFHRCWLNNIISKRMGNSIEFLSFPNEINLHSRSEKEIKLTTQSTQWVTLESTKSTSATNDSNKSSKNTKKGNIEILSAMVFSGCLSCIPT